jgi:DHA2 family multidrug resistance protein
MLRGVASRFSSLSPDPAHARQMFEGQLAQLVSREALTLAFQDVFTLMAGIFIAALLIVPFCKTPKLSDEPPPPAH